MSKASSFKLRVSSFMAALFVLFGAAQLYRAAQEPRSARTLFAEARRKEEGVFPPDLGAASQALEEALRLAPLESSLWLRLARLRLLAGRSAEAKAALDFADSLRPNSPRERAESIQLWALLGEPERARKLAQRLCALGQEASREAQRALQRAGL